jgi:hypothetical protein
MSKKPKFEIEAAVLEKRIEEICRERGVEIERICENCTNYTRADKADGLGKCAVQPGNLRVTNNYRCSFFYPRMSASNPATCTASKAVDLVDGDRQADYGEPVANMTAIGKAWESILGVPVSAEKVALCMASLKLVREANKHKDDNIIDALGYVEIAKRCAEATK